MAEGNGGTATGEVIAKRLREAAERALAEARARQAADGSGTEQPREINGRDGPEPVRYGDWEVKGLASDF